MDRDYQLYRRNLTADERRERDRDRRLFPDETGDASGIAEIEKHDRKQESEAAE